MQIKIFDVSNGQVTINENCLLIPELKKIVDTYEDPIPPLCFVHFVTDPLGPYANIPAARKEDIVYKDYKGKYTLDDEPIYQAVNKLKMLYETENSRLLAKAKIGLENLGDFIAANKVIDTKDGTQLNAYTMALSRIGKISQEFEQLEKTVKNELKARGDTNLGYDELD